MKNLKVTFSALIAIFMSISVFSNSKITCEEIKITDQETSRNTSTQKIIISYVEDFKNDMYAATPMYFGIQVPAKGTWTVNVTGKKKNDTWEVILEEGMPKTPTFIYIIEHETLLGIYYGKINALTAQGKAFAGDYTPMRITNMEGFKPTQQQDEDINPFSFHFWTKGFPEIIPFGEGMTRKAHGSNMVVFYYQKGLRTAYYRILPKEKVRHDPREQAMPFPMMVVAIEGKTEGEVNGKRVTLSKGQTIFLPPGTTHKWWNDTETPTEAILIMFGEGA